MSDFVLPPIGFGPGSQPMSEDDQLEYMQLPQDMRTFTPSTPEVDDATRVAPRWPCWPRSPRPVPALGKGWPPRALT